MLYRIYLTDGKIVEAPKNAVSIGNDWVVATGANMVGVKVEYSIQMPRNSIHYIVEVLDDQGYVTEQDEKDKDKLKDK